MRTIIFICSMTAQPNDIPTPPAEAWIEHAESELRRAGHRSSAPRSAVLELIGRQSCVLSAGEIAAELRSGDRQVGVATVYRTLELLESMRLVQRLDVGGTSARYEPALPGESTTITIWSAIAAGGSRRSRTRGSSARSTTSATASTTGSAITT